MVQYNARALCVKTGRIRQPASARHRTSHISWLRAAVLGANDGLISMASLVVGVAGSALVLLAVLGAVAAKVGGAGIVRGAFRVALWGALAMAVSALVGRFIGTTV